MKKNILLTLLFILSTHAHATCSAVFKISALYNRGCNKSYDTEILKPIQCQGKNTRNCWLRNINDVPSYAYDDYFSENGNCVNCLVPDCTKLRFKEGNVSFKKKIVGQISMNQRIDQPRMCSRTTGNSASIFAATLNEARFETFEN
jgi:hypothetical protein